MDFSSMCRTCLSTKSLNPIFRDHNNHNRYSLAVYLIAGIKVQPNDGLPQNMCTTCIHFLNEAFKFRKNCKTTQTELLGMKAQHNKQVKTDIDTEIKNKETKQTTKQECTPNTLVGESNKPTLDCNDVSDDYDNEDDKPLKYLFDNSDDDENILKQSQYSNKNYEENKYTTDVKCIDISKIEHSKDYKTNNETVSETQKSSLVQRSTEKLETDNHEVPYQQVTANRVTCKLCQKDLSIRSIDSHMARRHPGADRRKVKCELCDAYVLKGKLKRHMGMVHKSGCSRCGFCKAEFESKDSLTEHINSCTSKNKKRRINESGRELKQCDICHKTMQKASLKMHQAVKHAGLGPVCEHCGRRFGNKFRLNEHYRAKHGYEKFKCSYCDFQSAGVMAMRNHERRHRGEKPFVCETCGAKFHAAYLLAQHRHSHRTEKLVKCDLCPASFKANNSLHMHKSTCHSGSVYQCGVCGRAYSCRHYVVKHMRHVHADTGPPPRPMPVGHGDR